MNQKFLLFVLLFLSATFAVAQTTEVVADWETTETSYSGNSWGNGALGTAPNVTVANPNSSGINTSAMVSSWTKASDAKTWAGCGFTPSEVFNFKGTVGTVCIKVLATHGMNVKINLEGPTTDDPKTSLTVAYDTPNEWQDLCFDFSAEGLGHEYTKIALFLNNGATPATDEQYFFDDVIKTTGGLFVDPDERMISNNEPGEDTTHVKPGANGHFGASAFEVVANPNKGAYNMSDNVHSWCKANDAGKWSKFYYKIDTLDFTGSKAEVCISLLATHAATLNIQVSGSLTGPKIQSIADYTTPNEWQQICFDMTKPANINNNVGQGHIYTKLDFFFDAGVAITEDDCYYFDNVLLNANGDGTLPSLVENLVQQNSELSTFGGYVADADLWSLLNKKGVTVFIPTNAAFDAMPAAEKAALDDNTDNAIYNMILHHVVADSLPISLLTDGSSFFTKNGQKVTVTGTSVNGANISSSLEASNGFVHKMDAVMAYPAWPDSYLYSDFEGGGLASDNSGWWGWKTAGLKSTYFVANPHKDDDNPSDTVMLYKKFPQLIINGTDTTKTLWWQGIAHNQDRPYNFFGPMTEVCFDVYGPGQDHKIFLKLSGSKTPNGKTGWFQDYTGNSWQTVCFDATKPDYYDDTRNGINNIFPGTALFFDTQDKEFPADTAVYYLDNWQTKNVTVAVNNIEKLVNFEMSPNPTSDVLNISSDTPIERAFIYDISGRLMLITNEPIGKDINVSKFEAGLYFIRFKGKLGADIGTVRFVKQ